MKPKFLKAAKTVWKGLIRHWDWGYSGLQAEGNSRTIYATLEDNGWETSFTFSIRLTYLCTVANFSVIDIEF